MIDKGNYSEDLAEILGLGKTDKTDLQNSVPAGYKLAPNLIETKTKRVQLIMQPSLYEKARAVAKAKGLSFNSYIHEVLEKELKESEKSKESEESNH